MGSGGREGGREWWEGGRDGEGRREGVVGGREGECISIVFHTEYTVFTRLEAGGGGGFYLLKLIYRPGF